ncbi:hypothetical protein CMI46_02980 [Candidatus Pacearchaeota archaeon]|nr:hypothetical protein [Candidatus Pacearchaeota archaeon]|tara:strand:+ start:5423 stop:5944 length:522 start_codon:yes stop_codon:yes gene_type:complete
MGRGGIIFLVVVIVAVAVASYFVFFQTPKCDDIDCWEFKLKECRKASYINEAVDVTWNYKIKGKADDSCLVEVEAVQIIRGLEKSRVLEGKSMDCNLRLDENGDTIIVNPEFNPNICHGRLKEEMQTLIIERLHRYIVENVGEIAEGLAGIESVGVSDEGADDLGDGNVSESS